MDNIGNSLVPEPAAVGYPRDMVDDFIAAAEEERLRLEGVIADAEQRGDEARVAIGAHEVMVTMLVDAHRELSALELDAKQRAAAILDASDREAREILRSAHDERSVVVRSTVPEPQLSDDPPACTPVTRLSGGPIDLSALEALDAEPGPYVRSPVYANGNGVHRDAPGSDRYFDFLRGALVDDEPLGPRPE